MYIPLAKITKNGKRKTENGKLFLAISHWPLAISFFRSKKSGPLPVSERSERPQ